MLRCLECPLVTPRDLPFHAPRGLVTPRDLPFYVPGGNLMGFTPTLLSAHPYSCLCCFMSSVSLPFLKLDFCNVICHLSVICQSCGFYWVVQSKCDAIEILTVM